MVQNLLSSLSDLPAPLATGLIALIPSVELSVALPVGVLWYGLPLPVAFASAVLGSFSAVLIVYGLAEPAVQWLRRWHPAGRVLAWVFARTRGQFTRKYERYGPVALLALVAVPLPIPFSGAWSAGLAGWLFGISPRRALPVILFGLLIAGTIMAVLTVSGSTLLRWFLPARQL